MLDKKSKQQDDEIVSEDLIENDEIDPIESEEFAKDKISALRQKLKSCEETKREHLEALQRSKADFLNSKRRLEEQLKRDKERTLEQFISELLPLVDSFDMALQNNEAWKDADPKWKQGIEGIHNQLMSLLRSHNVTELEALGKPFDPALHEAVSNETVDKEEIDTVVGVLQKGFIRNKVIIRPARVIVGITK